MNHRREPPNAGSCPVSKKMRWKGRRAAKMVRAQLRTPGTIYRCQHCGDWHLTRQERYYRPQRAA